MRSRIVTSGMAAAAGVLVLGLSAPAFADSAADSASGELEQTVEATSGEDGDETDAIGETLEEADATLDSTEEQVDETAAEGPEPVAETVDDTTDVTTDTTDAVTDTLQQTAEDPTGSSDPDGPTGDDRRGAGGDPEPAPAPDGPTGATSVPDGRSIAGGGTSAPPARIALDGFRRTSGGTSTDLAVTADPIFEPEPAFAPPTTREVVEPTATAAPRLSLRTVAIEILVATALLVLATGGLVGELGPERQTRRA